MPGSRRSVEGAHAQAPTVIVRGRSNLLNDTMESEELARMRRLFDELERQEGLIDLLGDADRGRGVRIFIGSENKLFSLSGSSVILSPYRDANEKIMGVLGVIGPTRLNYARIVPVVDYTAQAISRARWRGRKWSPEGGGRPPRRVELCRPGRYAGQPRRNIRQIQQF